MKISVNLSFASFSVVKAAGGGSQKNRLPALRAMV
jgi:hypothetical protein